MQFAHRTVLRREAVQWLAAGPGKLDLLGISEVDGALVDLGVSSPQLDDPARGFSFREAGPLDMRMDPTRGRPLSERLEEWDEKALARILDSLGEERFARQIAR